MFIEVSDGEIVDKLAIIEIKLENIKDEVKLANIRKEYDVVNEAVKKIIDKNDPLYIELLSINKELWKIEDDIRDCERNKDFGPRFVELARAVYFTNDRRAEVKKRINLRSGSNLIEEKSYQAY
ncbi:MAG TPA: DUF6165 family protein [Smithella sp.]|nr:hypothetical protein [Smithella sp.]HNY49692.1 DUF6165 family protein [Smithella sp.]HOG89262.1 DUF6165 family protein [Smithella sp.]HOU50852.1 DUF6165 family protein [Smithella sp.]HQG64879.1 DUF6165 family protein [Smithella sp.]